jgi:DNA-binding NarL/FixJ family response regulator
MTKCPYYYETVNKYVIMEKLGVESLTDLTKIAIRRKLVAP